ncbi:hypothetical protein MUK42_36436 [Musa troglodytarum]|uniref:Uncharacterized protein n=1 Tax=Musa troglodytarum TaxID=320322 RepID=A0A9E7EGY3_9LILI|nr:hypothetical protein MUK42_36436 [Musa troglodytarum]
MISSGLISSFSGNKEHHSVLVNLFLSKRKVNRSFLFTLQTRMLKFLLAS